MNRSVMTKIAAAALAFGGAAAAHAATNVQFSVGVAQPAPVVVQHREYRHVQPAYPAHPVYEDRHHRDHRWRQACAAPRWDPQARYMPGDRVFRRGEVYVARRISASVWNVNSPPEWTPNYWRVANNC